MTVDKSRFKVGKNILSNRLKAVNNKMDLKLLSDSYNSYKIKMK